MREDALTFSIVVPTHGRPAQLERCLAALAALDYPAGRYEVIVVDDGSPTPLGPVVDRFAGRRLRVRLLRQRRRGPGAARNRGAAHATGAFLAFTDDDCTPAPGWLRALADKAARRPDHLLGGRVVNALPDNPFSTTSQLITTYACEYYERTRTREHFFTTNNLAVPTQPFLDLGGFDVTIPSGTAEDKEFCFRWLQRGHAMAYVPAAVVHHAHHLNLRRFWRQHLNYGRGILHYRLMSADMVGESVRLAPPNFYLGLLWFPLRQERGVRAWLHALLMATSQAATAAGALCEVASGRYQDARKQSSAEAEVLK